MTDTFGGDPHLDITIDADADAAAAEVQDAMANAIANAMKDPRIRAAIQNLVAAMTKGAQGTSNSFGRTWKDFESGARRAAKNVKGIFDDVGRAATKALKSPSTTNAAYNTLSQHIAAMANNMEELLRATREQVRVMEELGKSARATTRSADQQNRDATERANQELRSLSARRQLYAQIIKQAGQVATAAIRGFTRVVTSAQRAILRVIELTWKSAERAVRAFARGAAEVIRGLGRAVQSTFAAMGRVVAGFVRGAASALRGLGRGLGSVLSGMSRAFSSAFRRDESAFKSSLRRRERDLSASISRQQRSVQRAQGVRTGGLLGGLGAGGLLAGGGLAAFLSSGFTRAGQEESLQISFETLLRSGPQAEAVLQRISEFARTTSFDFVEVAKATQQLYAAFGDLGEAERITQFLADVTALAGGTTEEFSRARVGFGRIAQSGRLGAEELNIIEDAIPGIPIGQILADAFYGGDIAAFSAARLSGELGQISADEFFDAYEAGVRERFPGVEGAAQRMAGTLTGLAQNFKENLAIFGAEIIRLFEGPIKTAFNTANRVLGFLGGFISGEMFETGTSPTSIVPAPLPEELQRLKDLRALLADMAKAVAGVLAIVAAFKLFRLALIGVTSPLGLLVIGVAGIGAVFSKAYAASDRLRRTLKVLGDQVRPTLSALKDLGAALIGAFFRLFSGGDGKGISIFQRIGDGLAKVVTVLARGLRNLREWAQWLAYLINIGRGDLALESIGAMFTDINAGIANFLGSIVGISEEDITAEGGGIAGLLRNTFLAPIVNFFTNTLPDAISGFAGFIGDIWNAIFGGDSTGGPGAAFRAEEGGGGGIGSRLLDVLENMFLGPIVRFFRGPFADGVEAAIGQAIDIFRGLIDGIEAVWRFLEPILDPLTDAFRDFFSTFREEGAGAAFGSIGRGLLDTLGNIGSALVEFGANIPGYLESAANVALPFIADKLGPIWDAVTGWFEDTFTAENLLAAGNFFLDFLYEVGFVIGNALGDIKVWAGLFAATGAVILVLAQFFLGVFQGLISNAPEWGGIIAGGINDAIGGILPEDIFENKALSAAIGAAIIAAIAAGLFIAGKGILAAGSTVSAAGVSSFSWGKVPFGIASSLVGAIGREFKALWKGGQYLFTGDRSKIVGTDGKNSIFSGTGQKIGAALMAGIAIGVGGFKIGEAVGGPGGILLGALFGAGTGAAIGSAIAPGLGTAIGAVIGGVLGGISAAFGANAAAAEKAAREVNEYVDALERVEEGARGALAETVIANIKEGLSGAGEDFLIEAQFDAQAFVDSVLAGTYNVENAFSDMLTRAISGTDLSDAEFTFLADFQSELDRAIAAGFAGTEAFDQALLGLQEITGLPESELIAQLDSALGPLGLDASTLRDVMGTLKDEARELALGVNELGRTDALETTAERIDTVAEAVARINDELDGPTTAEDIASILSQADLTSEERLEALGDVADDIKDRFAEARDQLELLLNPPTAETTIGGITNQIVADLPSIASGFQNIFDEIEAGEIAPVISFAQVEGEVNDFRDTISDAILDGFDSGAIDSEAEFDSFLAGLRADIESADLAPAVEEQLLAVISGFEGMDLDEFFDLVGMIQQDQATVDAAGGILAAQLMEVAEVGADGMRPQARELGGKIAGEISAGITAAAPGIKTSLDDALSTALSGKGTEKTSGQGFGVAVDDSSIKEAQEVVRKTVAALVAGVALMRAAGEAMGTAAARGIGSAMAQIPSDAGSAMSRTVSAAGGYDDSMYNVGVNLGSALARGLASQLQAAARAAAAVAAAVVRAAKRALGIASPSRVFQNIGRDIGRGFIQGIKDGEEDMAVALSDAIEKAINKASERAAAAVRRAQVGQAIFDALAPSTLPGGTTQSDILSLRAAIQEAIAGFRDVLNQAASATLGQGAGAVFNAQVAAQGARLNLNQALKDLADKFAEAQKQQKAIDEYNKQYNKLREQRLAGLLTREEYAAALERLGERPVLTDEQIALLRTGPTTLDARTAAGQANIAALQQAIEAVRAWGQAALDAGAPVGQVIDQMQTYIEGIIAEARARGLNIDSVRAIIDQLGLSNADLARFHEQLLSLDIATISGAANVQNINEQLQAIRDYASELLASGATPATVAAQVRKLRDQLIDAARAFGFNEAQLQALVNAAGLSNTQLANFIRQLQEFEEAAAGATDAAAAAAEAERKRKEAEEAAEAAANRPPTAGIPQPLVGSIEVNLPYGDPEAVALAVANRVAYDAVTSW